MLRMVELGLYPKICRYAYVYHFKSITVKVRSGNRRSVSLRSKCLCY